MLPYAIAARMRYIRSECTHSARTHTHNQQHACLRVYIEHVKANDGGGSNDVGKVRPNVKHTPLLHAYICARTYTRPHEHFLAESNSVIEL